MATIPTFNEIDPTLEELKALLVIEGNSEKRRNYIGASVIGDECARKIWYGYKGAPKKLLNVESVLRFKRGHREEALMAEMLRRLPGINLYTHNDLGEQYGFMDEAFGGHFDGVIQGIRQAPKALHIWEHKSSGQKKFDEFKKMLKNFSSKKTLKNWNIGYWAQAQIYMHRTQINRHYTTVGLAGLSDFLSCRTEYDKEAALYYEDRAKQIAATKVAPARISDKPDWWQCRMCDFHEVCHANA